jgi:AraC-like DNA-binding protein
LITQGEQDFFRQVAGRREFHRVVEPEDPIALKMKEVCATSNGGGLLSRLTLLQLWVEAFGREWHHSQADASPVDVKERLRVFLQETPPEALLEIGFEVLARTLHCTPRHLSRVFYEVAGTSFREKRAEIRLSRARELLATSQSKVVDVAFKSGFKSLSLFNRMFTQRFGISPGRWRQKNENGGVKDVSKPRNGKKRLAINGRRSGRR